MLMKGIHECVLEYTAVFPVSLGLVHLPFAWLTAGDITVRQPLTQDLSSPMASAASTMSMSQD